MIKIDYYRMKQTLIFSSSVTRRISLLIIAIGFIMPMTASAQSVTIAVDASQNKRLISPNIYGKNDGLEKSVQFYKDAGLRFVRVGGNNATTYNWRAKLDVHPDWYNNVYASDWDVVAQRVMDNSANNIQGMFTFQLLGRVASSDQHNFNDWGFNQSQYWSGLSQNLAGGGVVNPAGGGAALVDGNIDLFTKPWPADSSVAILTDWFGVNGKGYDKNRFVYWSMDNEVDIWSGTHDYAMPTQLSASAFMDRYIELAKKAKAVNPDIKLCGPVTTSEWFWYKWASESIWINGKYYPWIEYFIKRLGDEYKATGIKLVDVIDIHNYPGYNGNDTAALQGHRIYYDSTYVYPGSNGIKGSTGGWDNSLNKQYIFKRINGWLNEEFGANNGISVGVSEWGTMSSSNPSLESVIYASHLGTFANNGVALFAPWNWSIGMWEALHLFSKNAKKYSVSSVSSVDTIVSAYSSINEAADSMTVILVNRDMNASRTATINLSNFNVDNGNYKTFQLSSLPATESFVSETQNALKANTVAVNSNSLTITVPALSTTAILLKKSASSAFVPDPNKIYNIIESNSNNVVGPSSVGSTQPALTDKQDLASQAFSFVSTGETDTYYLKNGSDMYLNRIKGDGWSTNYDAVTKLDSSKWVIEGVDATSIRLKNVSTNGYLAADGLSYGSSLYCNKSNSNGNGLYKLQEATIYSGTPSTVYNETFSPTGVDVNANWTGLPSTLAGANKWSGGIDLQTAGDGNLRLESMWSNLRLKLATTDSAVIINNINVSGYSNLQFSIDGYREGGPLAPTLYVKVGAGAWVLQSTQGVGNYWNWTTAVTSIKDASGIQLSNVSTISLKLSVVDASTTAYRLDNVKILGRPINYEFTGATSTDPTVSTNWLGGLVPGSTNDVTISGGTLVLNQNATYNSITVNPTAKLTLNNTKSLTLSNLLLKSDSTGTATFVDKNATPTAISGTVQQYLPATDRNWYVSSPIASATNGNLNTGANVVEYNEQLGTWPTVSGSLASMKGYVSTAGSAGTGTLSFSGNLNSGSKSISLSRKGSTSAGFNLVGNPYPSYLMWTQALANSANCLPTIWYRTKSAGVYSFQTYNASGDIGVPSSTTGYIPPMQAFWVNTSVDGSTLTVDNSMRSHGDGSSNLLKAPSASKTEGQLVRLQVSDGSNNDETLIYFNPNADNGFDKYDSPKMSVNNANIPEIFTTVGNEKLVINGMKTIPENIEIPLGLTAVNSGSLKITATQISNFVSGTQIVLIDKVTGNSQDLSNGSEYIFDNSMPEVGRFSLMFKVPSVYTALESENGDNSMISIFKNANNQIVINCEDLGKETTVSVYNAMGQMLVDNRLTERITIIDRNLKSGVYFVKVTNKGRKITNRIII
jgi:hypothetical protein